MKYYLATGGLCFSNYLYNEKDYLSISVYKKTITAHSVAKQENSISYSLKFTHSVRLSHEIF